MYLTTYTDILETIIARREREMTLSRDGDGPVVSDAEEEEEEPTGYLQVEAEN